MLEDFSRSSNYPKQRGNNFQDFARSQSIFFRFTKIKEVLEADV